MEYIDQLKIKGVLYTLKDPTVAAQINARIEELIGTAPSNLDTLQELAAAILSGDEALEGVLTSLASKTSKEYVDNLFNTILLTPGPLGEQGIQGPKGDTGATGPEGPKGDKGDKGDTGEQGSKGETGETGATGATGKSAYEVAVDNGFVGNEEAWLASLVGPQGQLGLKGETGAQGEKGDTGETGIQGPKGDDGKSAYDIYKESVVKHGDIYSFTSWSLDGNTAYGEGTVEVIEQRLGGATVKVLTNTDFGSNPIDFVGMEFDVQQPLNEGDLIQLYIGDEPQQIAVRATLQTPAVVAMTKSEWLASLKGADGQPGAAGQDGAPGQDGNDGITPHIDLTTGNWFIGETNTGVHAQGETGTFDPSDLDDYATKQEVNNKIGSLGNKVEAQAAVNYTEAEVNAANAELEGALEAESPLTLEQAGAYNLAVDGATKEEGDKLSEAEANMYNATLTGAISTSDIKTPAVTAVPYTNVGEVLSDIKTQLGGISIVKITQSLYTALQNKDANTLYVVIDD